ncbi:MAG: hypothetical protein V4642_11920 [Bacteroidota bacterium]
MMTLIMAIVLCGCRAKRSSNGPAPLFAAGYFPLTPGSTWIYEGSSDASGRTFTESMLRDTVLAGRTYAQQVHFDVQRGKWSRFYRRSGDTVFVLQGAADDEIFLIEKPDAKWSVSRSDATGSETEDFEVVDISGVREIAGKTFKDVVHVHCSLTSLFKGEYFTAESDLYFSRNVGMIEVKRVMESGEGLKTNVFVVKHFVVEGI